MLSQCLHRTSSWNVENIRIPGRVAAARPLAARHAGATPSDRIAFSHPLDAWGETFSRRPHVDVSTLEIRCQPRASNPADGSPRHLHTGPGRISALRSTRGAVIASAFLSCRSVGLAEPVASVPSTPAGGPGRFRAPVRACVQSVCERIGTECPVCGRERGGRRVRIRSPVGIGIACQRKAQRPAVGNAGEMQPWLGDGRVV